MLLGTGGCLVGGMICSGNSGCQTILVIGQRDDVQLGHLAGYDASAAQVWFWYILVTYTASRGS